MWCVWYIHSWLRFLHTDADDRLRNDLISPRLPPMQRGEYWLPAQLGRRCELQLRRSSHLRRMPRKLRELHILRPSRSKFDVQMRYLLDRLTARIQQLLHRRVFHADLLLRDLTDRKPNCLRHLLEYRLRMRLLQLNISYRAEHYHDDTPVHSLREYGIRVFRFMEPSEPHFVQFSVHRLPDWLQQLLII